MKLMVCYDKVGDVCYGVISGCDDITIMRLKKHDCVFSIVDMETGEVYKERDEEALRYMPMDAVGIDARDVLELRWYDTEDLPRG